MKKPINWQLPPAVHVWLNEHFPGQGDVPAKDAVRRQLGGQCEYTLALELGTSKTGVYRELLCREFPELGPLWPPVRYTPSQLEAIRRRTLSPSELKPSRPPATGGRAKLIAALRSLREDVINLSTPQIRGRLDSIIRKLEQ